MTTTEAGSDLDRLKNRIHDRSFAILREAHEHSEDVLRRARSACDRVIGDEGIDPARLSIVAVGSVGRREALSASDLDLVPIFSEPGVLSPDQVSRLRDRVREELGIDVSKGQDLTKECSIGELADLETIGGDHDETNALTRRVLVLTESAEVAGELGLATIRRGVLDAYAKHETTSGRHVLSLSNDVARYYRTLCIDYKAKIDTRDKAWCPRNAKLRHSRKFWYFSTMTAVVAAAIRTDRGAPLESLLTYFAMPPVQRSCLPSRRWAAPPYPPRRTRSRATRGFSVSCRRRRTERRWRASGTRIATRRRSTTPFPR